MLTWSHMYKENENEGKPEPQDRLDLIYYKGKTTLEEAETIEIREPKETLD